MPHATSIFHTGLSVQDLDASLVFKVEGLGPELRHRRTRGNEHVCASVGSDNARVRIDQLPFPDQRQPSSSGHEHVIDTLQEVSR